MRKGADEYLSRCSGLHQAFYSIVDVEFYQSLLTGTFRGIDVDCASESVFVAGLGNGGRGPPPLD